MRSLLTSLSTFDGNPFQVIKLILSFDEGSHGIGKCYYFSVALWHAMCNF